MGNLAMRTVQHRYSTIPWFAVLGVLFSLLSASAHSNEPLVLEIYPTYYQAHEVAAAIAPLLEEPETLTAHGNQLIIRAKDSTHDKILALLNQIDRPPRQLLLSLRPRQHHPVSDSAPLPDQPASSDNVVRIAKSQRPDEIIVYRGSNLDDRIAVQKQAPRLYSTRSQQLIQQVQLEEGKPGWLPAGEKWFWQLSSAVPTGNRTPSASNAPQPGFHLRAQIDKRGDIVIDITQPITRRDTVIEKTVTEYQTLETLIVKPGTWMPIDALSSVQQNASSGHSGQTHYRTKGAQPGHQALDIRVDILE